MAISLRKRSSGTLYNEPTWAECCQPDGIWSIQKWRYRWPLALFRPHRQCPDECTKHDLTTHTCPNQHSRVTNRQFSSQHPTLEKLEIKQGTTWRINSKSQKRSWKLQDSKVITMHLIHRDYYYRTKPSLSIKLNSLTPNYSNNFSFLDLSILDGSIIW